MQYANIDDYAHFPLDSTPVTYYQTTSFRLFQTERVCRRRFQI